MASVREVKVLNRTIASLKRKCEESSLEDLLNTDLDDFKNLKKVADFLEQTSVDNKKLQEHLLDNVKILTSNLIYNNLISKNSEKIKAAFKILNSILYIFHGTGTSYCQNCLPIIEKFSTANHANTRDRAIEILNRYFQQNRPPNYKDMISNIIDKATRLKKSKIYHSDALLLVFKILNSWKTIIEDDALFQKFQLFVLGFGEKYSQDEFAPPILLLNICKCIAQMSQWDSSLMFLQQVDHILLRILSNKNLHQVSLKDSGIETQWVINSIENVLYNIDYNPKGFIWKHLLKIFDNLFFTDDITMQFRNAIYRFLFTCRKNGHEMNHIPAKFITDAWNFLIKIFSNFNSNLPSCLSILILQYIPTD